MVRWVLALAFVLTPLAGFAASPAPVTSEKPRDGGTIEGKIATIDYQTNMLAVESPGRGRVEVTLMPSTSVQSRDGSYHAVSDLKPGQRVRVLTSLVSGRYVAQIVSIL